MLVRVALTMESFAAIEVLKGVVSMIWKMLELANVYARALKVSVAVVVDRHVKVWKERTYNFVVQIIANLWKIVFGIDSIGEPLFDSVFAHESSVAFATQVWLLKTTGAEYGAVAAVGMIIE